MKPLFGLYVQFLYMNRETKKISILQTSISLVCFLFMSKRN
nr:MAG TPA: hypothetical protein [Caudoviricetes sp.]